MAGVLAKANLGGDDIKALDDDGQAVRPAIIWMDIGSSEETHIITEIGEPALRINSRLAELGCSPHEIMSITGHKSISEIETYTRAAIMKRLAAG